MPEGSDDIAFNALLCMMLDNEVTRVYAKNLSPNDNSKNQPYFGGDFSALNILPIQSPQPSSGSHSTPIFKARLDFAWFDATGRTYRAPNAKLILYPQYPEVRFSGYLKGCHGGPSQLMGTTREAGRVLFLGVRDDGRIFGYAAAPDSQIAREFAALRGLEQFGVFYQVPLPGRSGAAVDRIALLTEICRIAQKGWIPAMRLRADGSITDCRAPNCGGYTLEAELGIRPNGYSEPDFRGWEVKQHSVSDFLRYRGGPVTLMTPEPTAGFYVSAGVIEFVKRYGYADMRGRPDRLNFGGLHRAATLNTRTGLTLTLVGYDAARRRISDPSAGIALLDPTGACAAMWTYAALIAHWNRKHARAAYIPSLSRKTQGHEYRFADQVRLGTGTDFLKFLAAMDEGLVYYDPGIKVERSSSSRPTTKRRSQFRIASLDLSSLYEQLQTVNACAQVSRDGFVELDV